MTEKEAIEIIKQTPLMRYMALGNPNGELGEALEMAVGALEMMLPKKPFYRKTNGIDFACPCCGLMVKGELHCCHCGQRLDWGE